MTKAVARPVFDSESSLEHAPELYSATGLAEPIDTLDAFDEAAMDRYERDGYLAIENAFSPDEIQSAL